MTTPSLFEPVRVGRYDLPNRIAMAPMTRNRSPGAVPNALNARYYGQRASASLIVTEGVAPSAAGQGYIDIPGLYTHEQVAGWRLVADAVHAGNGRIFAQLMHVGRVSHPSFLGGDLPVAPSPIRPAGEVVSREGRVPFLQPRELSHDEILRTIDDYAAAAHRAVQAGLDGVEVHGANGYLPHQFLAAGSNVRTDRWGGSVAARARFLLEVTDAVASAIGADRVGVRLSPGSSFNDIHEPDASDSYTYVAAALKRRSLAYLHVVDVAPGFDVPDLIRRHYDGTLILNGGYDRARADAAIATGRADLVSFGAPFIANPDLVERMRDGAALNRPDPATFYGGDARGYTDYPVLSGLEEAA